MDRTAFRRVGAAAAAAFVLLLVIGASHRPAQADPVAPAATPDSGSQVEPQQQQPGFPPGRDGSGVPGPDGSAPDGGGFGVPGPAGSDSDGGGHPPISPAQGAGTDMS